MKISEFLAGISTLCILGGCALAAGDGPAGATSTSEERGDEVDPNTEPRLVDPPAAPPEGAPLIRGSVSGIFPMEKPGDCQPLGVPITLFLGALDQAVIVDETATPARNAECLHEQVLAASADAWASLAYGGICGGGGDARLCGAQGTRICSVDLMLRWSDERTEPVASTDLVFGFAYVVPPLDEASRTALDRRALREVESLLRESEAVLSEYFSGTRNCSEEDCQEITRRYVNSFGLYQRISERLADE